MQEREKMIYCVFFLYERCILGIETAYFGPNTLTLTKLEPNEIFIDFSMSWDQIHEIDLGFFYFKDMGYKIPPESTRPDFMKIAKVGAE